MRASDMYGQLIEAVVELTWNQWSAIGVAGVRTSVGTIVDPEALTLATLEIGRSDARLFDEMLDWIASNSRLLDMARLRRLGKRAQGDQRRLLGVVAQEAIDHGSASSLHQLAWAGVLAHEEAGTYGIEPLFRSQDANAADWAAPDERFRQAGFLRPKPDLRGMSLPPDATLPACLRFRARALVGPGARAEVLTYLWTHDWAHGRLIAERAAYNQAPVAEYLAELAEARLVDRRTDGRKVLYRLAGGLREVVSPVPVYVDWVAGWPALVALLDALRPAGLSEDAEWVRLSDVFQSHAGAFAGEGFRLDLDVLRDRAVGEPGSLADAVDAITQCVRRLAQ